MPANFPEKITLRLLKAEYITFSTFHSHPVCEEELKSDPLHFFNFPFTGFT